MRIIGLTVVLLSLFTIISGDSPLYGQGVLTQEEFACQFIDRGNIQEARKILEKELKTTPHNLTARLYLGIALYLEQDIESAFKEFEKIEKELDRSAGASFTFGDEAMFTQMGMDRKATAFFTDERKGLLYFCRGLTLKEKKDYKNAEKKFKTAQKYKYHNSALIMELIDLSIKKKDFKQASEDLGELKSMTGENNILTFLKGYLHYFEGNVDTSLASFEEIESQIQEAKKNRGIIFYNKKDYQKAIEIWEEILSQQPDDNEVQVNLGRAFIHLGDAQKAQEYFDRAGLKITPDRFSLPTIALTCVTPFKDKKFDLICKRN